MTVSEKLKSLRRLMKDHHIDAWIIPSSDPHQSEYVAPRWKGRAWLSGFTGSAGTVVVTPQSAGLWTDSRYFLQAESELEGSGIDLYKMGTLGVPELEQWLLQQLNETDTVGFDGKQMSMAQTRLLKDTLDEKNIRLAYDIDLLDEEWTDRPEVPLNPMMILDDQFTGESRVDKLKRIRDAMVEQNVHIHVLSSLDDIAWTFNIRGTDVDFNPVVICYAVITREDATLYVHPSKIPENVKTDLGADGISFAPYEAVFDRVAQLPPKTTVLLDPNRTNQALADAVSKECVVKEATNPTVLMKACKNETELAGIRAAHIRDGVAMVKWMVWLDTNLGTLPMDEISVAEQLESCRREGEYFQGLSFNTICGYQGNGAIVHYAAKPDTAATIEATGMLLIDSGGQYLDGTTDITRTLTLNTPTTQQKRDFTLVLKGHIDLALATFPAESAGSHVDTFARSPLWEAGVNYGHGTGHGVGHFLNVHEGPQQIRPTNHSPLKLGMLTSNEPGLYREGEYGIRIENLIVTRKKQQTEFAEFWEFETVSLCPIDLDLVEPSMLTDREREWLNAYHHTVYEKLSPGLTKEEKTWLKNETRSI